MTTSNTSTHIDWQAAGDETINHLRNLLRLDTRNPPGNETQAAAYLRAALQAEGIASEIVGPGPDRGTLIARLKGDGSAPPLLLMSHTDVVAVEPEKWTHDPFAADLAGGFVYGRGALDMKGMVTMEHDPEATPIPTMVTGGTDAKHVSKLGTKVYGFAPELYIPGVDDGHTVHGHDERISIASIHWGVQVLYDVAARFAGQTP